MALPGVKVFDLKRLPDERGFFAEVMREDWVDLLGGDRVVQANLSLSYPGVVRAWHRHLRGQVDYFVVLRGALKICAYDDREGSETFGWLDEVVACGDRLQVVRVPGFYWHGTKCVGVEPSLTLYFVNRLYDYKSPDEERRAWDDRSVVPRCVNGSSSDPRVGKPWDWFYPPHK
jgi:dTDP-4-dehydrorhamnose 3,5-epimerase